MGTDLCGPVLPEGAPATLTTAGCWDTASIDRTACWDVQFLCHVTFCLSQLPMNHIHESCDIELAMQSFDDCALGNLKFSHTRSMTGNFRLTVK